jgi:hypothetical protein
LRTVNPHRRRSNFIWLAVNIIACGGWYAYADVRESLASDQCEARLRECATACFIYSMDNDAKLPNAGNWMDATLAYTPGRENYSCPVSRSNSSNYGHAFSVELSSKRIAEMDNDLTTPVVFDTDHWRWNSAGKADRFRLKDGSDANAAFMDGGSHKLRGVTASPSSGTELHP